MKVACALAVALAAAATQAGDIFFDTFSGSTLKPHWQQPPPQHWVHHVADGRLSVTDVLFPGVPGQPNTAAIHADFPLFASNRAVITAHLDWEAGQGRALSIRLWGPRGLEAAMGYDETGPVPVIFLEKPGAFPPPIRTAPAPSPGPHEFKLVDDHSDGLILFVDGVPQLGFGTPTGDLLSRIEIVFSGTKGVAFSPMHVGFVRIVPGPASASFFAFAALAGRRRRR